MRHAAGPCCLHTTSNACQRQQCARPSNGPQLGQGRSGRGRPDVYMRVQWRDGAAAPAAARRGASRRRWALCLLAALLCAATFEHVQQHQSCPAAAAVKACCLPCLTTCMQVTMTEGGRCILPQVSMLCAPSPAGWCSVVLDCGADSGSLLNTHLKTCKPAAEAHLPAVEALVSGDADPGVLDRCARRNMPSWLLHLAGAL